MAKRINHKKLHAELENLGYEIYTCDYKYGTHTYQLEKENESHEYHIENLAGERVVNIQGVNSQLYDTIKQYYTDQGIKIV